MASPNTATVDEYIAAQTDRAREVLEAVRAAIHAAIPGAGEKISYAIPTVTLGGRAVIYFAAWARHLSVYPVPEVSAELDARLAPYRAAKGTLRFPLAEPVPLELIAEVAALLASQLPGARE